MQTLIGILIGVVIILCAFAFTWLVLTMRELVKEARECVIAMKATTAVFMKSGEMATNLAAQVAVSKRMISTMESLGAAMKMFNSLITKNGEGGEEFGPEPQRASGRTPPPPPFNPSFEEFAAEGESGVLSQDDEEMALEEARRYAREQGQETDEDLVMPPSPEKINYAES